MWTVSALASHSVNRNVISPLSRWSSMPSVLRTQAITTVGKRFLTAVSDEEYFKRMKIEADKVPWYYTYCLMAASLTSGTWFREPLTKKGQRIVLHIPHKSFWVLHGSNLLFWERSGFCPHFWPYKSSLSEKPRIQDVFLSSVPEPGHGIFIFVDWFRCVQGSADAQFNLGMCYLAGRGCEMVSLWLWWIVCVLVKIGLRCDG
jgi:hypothetical protein